MRKSKHKLKKELKRAERHKEWLKKKQGALAAHETVFSTKKDFLLQAYNTTIVDSYWQDLLTEAAKIQDLPEPTFDRVSGTVLVDVNGKWFPEETVNFFHEVAAKSGLLPKQEAQLVERHRRVRPTATLIISSIMDEFIRKSVSSISSIGSLSFINIVVPHEKQWLLGLSSLYTWLASELPHFSQLVFTSNPFRFSCHD